MNISIIDMPLFYGCDNPGVENGGEILKENKLLDIFKENHNVWDMGKVFVDYIDSANKYATNDKMKYLDEVIKSNLRLAHKVQESLQNNFLPVVIGGDHSLALGSLAGSSNYYGNELAVVWVDAHGDINTNDTSPSGNIHGMPLAASMGIGHEALTNLYYNGIKIKPENVFIIAARDLDSGELDLIDKLNLNVWTMKDIKDKGIDTCLKEFISALTKLSVSGIHFSFDIDCLDPTYVPGTGTPVHNGLTFQEGEKIIETVMGTKLVRALDFVEFNPTLDKNNKTLETCISLLKIFSNSFKNNQ